MNDTTSLEIELTFLAKDIPQELTGATPTHLVDIYIPDNMAIHPHVRLRQKGTKYEITKKIPQDDGDASVQTEQTIPLEESEFTSLAAGHNRRVEKDRYNVTIEGYPAEVDVFRGVHEGLVMIDFEFTSLEAKAAFKVPACCGPEVTQELFAAGGHVAGRSYAELAPDLTRFNYEPKTLMPSGV